MSELEPILQVAGATPEIAGAVAGAWAIRKVLGPSVSAVGTVFGDYTEYRLRNLLRLDEKVARRLNQAYADDPAEEDDPELGVHPRVAREVLDEGSWIDDDLHQEYLAGLLVGARTKDGTSDAQAYLARIATTLTSEQVKLHYAVVSAYAGYWNGGGAETECPFPFGDKQKYRQHAILAERAEVLPQYEQLESAAKGLVREGLLQDYGRPPAASVQSESRDDYIAFVPSPLAFDLYLQALARPGRVGLPGLMFSREHLAFARTAPRGEGLKITYPDPEPPLMSTARVHDLGL